MATIDRALAGRAFADLLADKKPRETTVFRLVTIVDRPLCSAVVH